jgi:hypothetical protein
MSDHIPNATENVLLNKVLLQLYFMAPSNLFNSTDLALWSTYLKGYDDAFEAFSQSPKKIKKANELLDLEKWYRQDLGEFIAKHQMLDKAHLVKLIEWKLTV